jgi:short-subunit dehydrogenase
MIERKKGGVLMVSSMFSFVPSPVFGTYCATKFFVRGFSDSLRAELAPLGISVTQLCPGPVKTPFLEIASTERAQMRNPSLVEITVETCVRQALQGFEKGRAIVVPGFLMKLGYVFYRLTPEWFMKLLLIPMGKVARKIY